MSCAKSYTYRNFPHSGYKLFINALRRFITRWDAVIEICSDNATNFVGAKKELKLLINEWNQTAIHNFLLQKQIKWIFNTPATSHHGGVWERCIRSVQKILNSVVGQQTLDDESLTTFMCEVENIIFFSSLNHHVF